MTHIAPVKPLTNAGHMLNEAMAHWELHKVPDSRIIFDFFGVSYDCIFISICLYIDAYVYIYIYI